MKPTSQRRDVGHPAWWHPASWKPASWHAMVWWVIPMAALVAVLPLVLHGCSCGHDFDFHLVSWFEAAAQFRAGTLHPAWAFSPGWDAGEPRFVFYPPLSWTVGAVLGMVLPWTAVPVVYTWLALVAAGFGMYWLGQEVGARSAVGPLIAAVLYVANPYMMFTAYERTAYAELLAAAWIPLLLAGVLRERVTVLRIAVPVALLWLTNAPAAVMGCYALALLAAVRVVSTWRRSVGVVAIKVVAGTALGLGLAAFYVVPAAFERRWVQIAMAMVSGMRIGDNFLFHRTGDGPHDEVLHTASVLAVGMLAAAVLVLAAVLLRAKDKRQAGTLAVLVVAIGGLLLPVSAVVWRVAPELAFLQFPWRWTMVLAAVAGAGVALRFDRWRLHWGVVAAALVVAAGMSWSAATVFRQACDEEDTVAARLAVFKAKSGSEPTDEYTPGEADNDVQGHANPAFWLAANGDAGPPKVLDKAEQVPERFSLHAAKDEVLVLNLRDYPAWRVRVNGALMSERVQRADGLIAVPVAAGEATVEIAYAMTRDREAGDAVSGAAVFGVLGLVVWRRRRQDGEASGIIED